VCHAERTPKGHVTNAETSPKPAPESSPPDYLLSEARAGALLSLVALAPGLGEAELRVCLYLASIENPGHGARASSRQLAKATRLSRSNVQRALDSLNQRCLIATREGTATRSGSYLLNFTHTVAFKGGLTVGPPPAQMSLSGGPVVGPPVWATLPPVPGGVASQQGHPSEPVPPVDISIQSDSILDRVLTAKPTHFDRRDLSELRPWVDGYWRQFGPLGRDAHPLDDTLLAQLLTVAPLEQLIRLLKALFEERKKPELSPGWFITIALQREHGIEPAATKARRADLRIARRPQSPQPTQDNLEFTAGLIGDLAKAKGM